MTLTASPEQGGTIRGSINLPAQSLYPTRAAIFQMSKASGVSKIIFYCGNTFCPPLYAITLEADKMSPRFM